MAPAHPNTGSSSVAGDGVNKDQASVKVPSKDPKKKDEKDEDLSEEDLALKQQLELYVERVQDSDPGLQKVALESMRQEIRTATSSMTSVPKPLKFLRPHYGTLQAHYEKMTDFDLKKLLADILSVLALTMSPEGERASLKYRLLGSHGDIGSWGHEYVRNLAGEIAQEYGKRQGEETSIDDLMDLVVQIVAFHMKHNAEPEAVDLLMEMNMVSCLNNPTAEEAEVAEQIKYFKIQSLSSDLKRPASPNDHKMADSGEHAVGSGSDISDFRAAVEGLEIGGDKICDKELVEVELSGGVSGPEKCETGGVTRSEVMGSELVDSQIIDEGVLSRGELCENSVYLGCSIDEPLGKVNLDELLNASIISEIVDNLNGKIGGVDDFSNGDVLNSGEMIKVTICDATDGSESGVKSHEVVNDKCGNSIDDTESEDESSSSSSSSSDDEDEHDEDIGDMAGGKTSNNKEGGEVDVEEGEILSTDADEMVGWSDNENDEDGGSGAAGPVKSKNELKILPPVPSVTVTLQPHHQILPVGIILSIIGAQVIVEGIEKHNPLNEGSILWITERRSPLGIIDEIFGPVKNPYYVVRYNCESEVPSNIQQGTSISFASDFANHVLNDKYLYQKGYDASGENDEELSDELEFSDDEKESEYKKMLKMKKRGTSESKPGTKRKEKRQFKNQLGNWKSNQVPSAKTPNFSDNLPFTESLNNGSSAGLGLACTANQAIVPPLPVQTPMPGFCAPNGIWGNGFLCQQPLNISDLSGVPAATNFMRWMHQNQPPFQLHQMPPVQNSTIPGLPFNFSSSGNQPNFCGVPAFTPWLGLPNQNVFNQSSTGIGSQTPLPQNVVEQVFQCDGSQVSNSFQPSLMNFGNPHNFVPSRGGGRRGQNRGGRHYGGGIGTSRGR